MTLIEFLDRSPVEDLTGCLTVRADKVVLIGDKGRIEGVTVPLEQILRQRGAQSIIETREVPRGDLHAVEDILRQIIEQDRECVIDLTGGEDLCLVCAGQMYERYHDQGIIGMQWYDLHTGHRECWGTVRAQPMAQLPSLTVDEAIRLQGGCVVYEDDLPSGGTRRWAVDDLFVEDMKRMWEICRHDPGWNEHTALLYYLTMSGVDRGDELTISMDGTEVETIIRSHHLHHLYPYSQSFFEPLLQDHLLTRYDWSARHFYVRFKNERVKRCLTKAGALLELIIWYAAAGLRDEEGRPVFQDTMTGARIDWDDVIHAPENPEIDTQNEIDVILMRGLMPIFISCKNGKVSTSELYKLYTVADRFHRGFGKKVLICTELSKERLGAGPAYLMDRAKAMDIEVISDIHKMSLEQIGARLERLVH